VLIRSTSWFAVSEVSVQGKINLIKSLADLKQTVTVIQFGLKHLMNKPNSQTKCLQRGLAMYLPDLSVETSKENWTCPRTALVIMWPANVYSNRNPPTVRTESYDLKFRYRVHIFVGERRTQPCRADGVRMQSWWPTGIGWRDWLAQARPAISGLDVNLTPPRRARETVNDVVMDARLPTA
jgi:hypothetical protein